MKSAFRLGLLILALTSVLLFPQQNDLSKTKVLYTVGYAHLDTQWRWDYQTTINEYIWNTMAFNFKLFEKYPDYVFNFSGANRYKMMKEYYPEEFERVKKYAAAGRWFPSGASMEENDVLAPSHESIIRQILLGSGFFRRELGVTSQEFMIPDCFGFPASLPSILAHCGLQGFSTQKLTWGSAVGIPFNVGTWIGPDGRSVTAALNPGDYSGLVSEDLSANAQWKARIEGLGAKAGAFTDYMYYGTGDVGGSPSDDSVAWIEKSLKSNRDFKVVSAPSDQMFKDLTPAQKAKLPTYKGEMLLTNHSSGSITSQAAMKRWNRKNELAAARAESAAVVGEWLGGLAYPRERLDEAWRLVLGGQFHDILPGTSIPRAYEFSWNDELVASNQFNAVFAGAAGAVVRALDTEVKGIPFVVANPLALEREDSVEAQVAFDAAPKAVRVFDRDGKEVPSQVTRADGSALTVLFLAKVPSLGYAVFDIRPAESPCALATGLKASGSSLENGKYLVKLDAAGDVVSIFDKIAGRELLAAPARLEFHYERPAQWPAWNMDWEDRIKPASGFVGGPAKITIVENGPARVALAVERESRHSKVVQVIRLSAAGSRDRVEFASTIDWATKESSLKASFPLTVANPKATYNWGVGTIERGNNDPVKFEVPSHQWFDLTDTDGRYGVAVLEDCKYGSDKPADNIVRLTLLYTPGVRGSYREQAYQDFGRHEILYALYGHSGDWRAADVNLQGDRLNQPLVVFRAASHIGSAGKALSFLAVNNKDVVVSAVKKAEAGDEVIVRVVEAKGKAAKGVALAFAAPVAAAREVNGQEQDLGPAAVKDGKLVFDITPYSLRTFALKLQPPASPLAPAVSAPVDLPYNVDVISPDKHKSDGDFDGMGRSFPAELIPDTITSDGILFKMGPKADGALNAVACAGQTVNLPAGNFNRLYLLAAAQEGGARGGDPAVPTSGSRSVFKVGGKPVEITVEAWAGFYGQWDKRLWDGDSASTSFDRGINYVGLAPAYVRKDAIAWFTTHRHLRSGANDPYMYAYIYKYRVDLPAGAKEITFPSNERIKVFALTAAANQNDDAAPAQPLSDTLARDRRGFGRFAAVPKPLISPEKAFIDYARPLAVTMLVPDEAAEIRYTLDGSLPTETSPLYTGPISLTQSTVITAAAFDPVRLPSVPAVATFSRSLPVKSARYIVQPPAGRGGGGASGGRALIDLVRAAEPGDRAWQMFGPADLDVVLDLGQVRTVEGLVLGTLENHGGRVFLPVAVEIATSLDDKDYKIALSEKLDPPSAARPLSLKSLAYDLKKTPARYIRVKAKNIGTLPAWHQNAGQPAQMAFDEILIK
jgi:alpha-mannosidase